MTNKNEKSVNIERFILPEKCPKCDQFSKGSVTCKKCGLYFYRYNEILKADLNSKDFYEGINQVSKKRFINKNNCLLFLIAASIITVFSFSNISISGRQHGINGKNKIEKIVVKKEVNLKNSEINNFSKTKKRDNKSQLMVATRDSILMLYNGRESFNEGVALYGQKRYSESADKFMRALEILEKSGHMESIAKTKLNLAICYYTLSDYINSLFYFEEVLDISRKNELHKIEEHALQGKSLILDQLDKDDNALIL